MSNGNGTAVAAKVEEPPPEQKTAAPFDFFMQDGRQVVYFNGAVPGDVEEVRRATAYAAAAYIYVAIRYRAEKVAEAPLRIYEETADGVEVLADHPLQEILDDPSPDYDLGELVELYQTFWDIDGDALLVKDPNLLGRTGRLTPFAGSEYDVRQTVDRIFGAFGLKTDRGAKKLEPEDVIYFRYPNPYNRQRGLSPTDVALHTMNLGQRTTATIRSLLKNALFPSVVITTHPEWHPDDAELERFKDLINQYHTGPQNAGKPFVALGGGRVERVSFTLQELVPEALLDRVEAITASCFRIPAIVLGHLVGLKNSPWSQMEQAHRQGYTDGIFPLWRRGGRAWTRQFLWPVEPNRKRFIAFDTSEIAALREDESKKITDASSATTWTVNERRIHTGQDPLPEGDERGEFIELTDAVRFPALPSFGDDPEDEVELGNRRRHARKAEDPRDAHWKRFDVLTKAQEAVWASGVYSELRKDRDGLLAVTRQSSFVSAWESLTTANADRRPLEGKAPPPPFGGDPGAIKELIARLEAALDPDRWGGRMGELIESTARTALKELAAEVGVAFDVIEPTLVGYTRDEAAWLVRQIDQTTRDRIALDLAAGLEAGETISGLRDRIQESVGFSRGRAELVARTETTRVTNGSQRQAMSDYQRSAPEVVTEKSWLSARDSRVRDEHVELDDGSWIETDGTFANGLQAPGEPNCRCTLLHRIRED